MYIVHNHYEEEKEKNTKKGESKETIEIPELSDVINRVDIPTPRESINKLDEEIARIEKERAEAEKREQERLAKLEEERKKRQAEKEEKKNIVTSRGERVGKTYIYEATFYTAFCPTGCVGKTASGYDVSNTIYYKGMRIVAMPPHIPLYTEILVEFKDGTKFKAIVLDRGGDIKGSDRIDILVSTREEARKLGRQNVKVTILNK